MIIDKIVNLKRYDYVPNVQKVIDFLDKNDIKTLEIGSYDLGDDCKLKVSNYKTKEVPDVINLEAHREYLDLQIAYFGEENMYFQALELGEENTPYNEAKDVEFYTASWCNTVVLDSDNFALIFPNDLHMGSFQVDGESEVKKLVFKLKI